MIPNEGELEELAANRHVVLMSDENGYTLWRMDAEGEEPTGTFPATIAGSDAAWDAFERATWRWRVGRLLRGLLWTAGILGGVTIVTGAFNYVWFALLATGHLTDAPGWLGWFQVANLTAWTAFLTTSAIYVLVWLQRHPKAGRRRFYPIEP
jgi:hypothetical protein